MRLVSATLISNWDPSMILEQPRLTYPPHSACAPYPLATEALTMPYFTWLYLNWLAEVTVRISWLASEWIARNSPSESYVRNMPITLSYAPYKIAIGVNCSLMHKSNEFICDVVGRMIFCCCCNFWFLLFTLNNLLVPCTYKNPPHLSCAINSPHGVTKNTLRWRTMEKLSPWLRYFIGCCTNGWFD